MTNNNLILEVCVDSLENALIAQSAGADRVELCSNLSEGGTTPSPAQIQMARKDLQIKLYVLIRPRGGDFLYNDREFEIMKLDIHFCGKNNCDGIVIGMLNSDDTVDMNHCSELLQIARQYNMGVTFHRAFDRSNNLFQALEDIISLGCERILTSGGYDTAIEGADVIKELIEKAGDRITIMPGAGITPENYEKLINKTGLNELHGSFRSRFSSKILYKNQNLHQEDEYTLLMTDAEKIKAIK